MFIDFLQPFLYTALNEINSFEILFTSVCFDQIELIHHPHTYRVLMDLDSVMFNGIVLYLMPFGWFLLNRNNLVFKKMIFINGDCKSFVLSLFIIVKKYSVHLLTCWSLNSQQFFFIAACFIGILLLNDFFDFFFRMRAVFILQTNMKQQLLNLEWIPFTTYTRHWLA